MSERTPYEQLDDARLDRAQVAAYAATLLHAAELLDFYAIDLRNCTNKESATTTTTLSPPPRRCGEWRMFLTPDELRELTGYYPTGPLPIAA